MIGISLLFVGLAVLLYPFIAGFFHNRQTEQMISSFEETVKDSQFDKLYELLKQENKRLYEEGQKDLKDPFSYTQPTIDLTQFGLKENIIGYIEIPKIKQKLPIRLGANEENMSLGATHLTQTSYPIGGEHTNSVIAAHRGYSEAYMFREIDKLQKGDFIYIHNFQEKLTYRVSEIQIIEPDESDKILITKGKDQITLMSCHPFTVNSQRYLVYCERVKETESGGLYSEKNPV